MISLKIRNNCKTELCITSSNKLTTTSNHVFRIFSSTPHFLGKTSSQKRENPHAIKKTLLFGKNRYKEDIFFKYELQSKCKKKAYQDANSPVERKSFVSDSLLRRLVCGKIGSNFPQRKCSEMDFTIFWVGQDTFSSWILFSYSSCFWEKKQKNNSKIIFISTQKIRFLFCVFCERIFFLSWMVFSS